MTENKNPSQKKNIIIGIDPRYDQFLCCHYGRRHT